MRAEARSESLHVVVESDDDRCVVWLQGELGPSDGPDLQDLLIGLHARALTVDLSGLTLVDSNTIDVLYETKLKYQDQGVGVVFPGQLRRRRAFCSAKGAYPRRFVND